MVWVSGLFIELHPDAYRDIILNFTAIYLLIAVGFIIRKNTGSRGLIKSIIDADIRGWTLEERKRMLLKLRVFR